MRRTLLLLFTAFCLLPLTACEEPTYRPSRAISSPTGTASAQREVLAEQPAGAVGVPLITVGMPNDKDDTAHVRTIGDNIRETTATPTTAPATAPSTAPAERTGTIDLTPRGTPPAPR